MKILINHAHSLISDELQKLPGVELHFFSKDSDFMESSPGTKYDALIVQGLKDLPQALQKLKDIDLKNVPVIIIEHTLPYPIPTEEHRRVSNYVNAPEIKKVVFISSEQVSRWRLPGTKHAVIAPAIDVEQYPTWEGGDTKLIAACNNMMQRDWSCGYNFWNQVTWGFPRALYGSGNEDCPESQGSLAKERLMAEMQRSLGYVNSALHSTLPTSLLEAMAVGMPVFSTATYTPMLLHQKYGANLFLSNCIGAMRCRIREVLENPDDFRKKFIDSSSHVKSRKAIRLAFSPERFATDWKLLLEEISC